MYINIMQNKSRCHVRAEVNEFANKYANGVKNAPSSQPNQEVFLCMCTCCMYMDVSFLVISNSMSVRPVDGYPGGRNTGFALCLPCPFYPVPFGLCMYPVIYPIHCTLYPVYIRSATGTLYPITSILYPIPCTLYTLYPVS